MQEPSKANNLAVQIVVEKRGDKPAQVSAIKDLEAAEEPEREGIELVDLIVKPIVLKNSFLQKYLLKVLHPRVRQVRIAGSELPHQEELEGSNTKCE
jgi:hypothetical protein